MSGWAPPASRLETTRGGQHHRPRSSQPAPLESRPVGRPPALHRRRRSRHHHSRHQPLNMDLSWLTDQPTADQMEELFLSYLAAGIPQHFSTSLTTAPLWLSPWLLSSPEVEALPGRLVLDSRSGASYLSLFGSWSEEHGYRDGCIVDTLRRLESHLDPEASPDMDQARGYLAEAIVARWERLAAVPTDGRLYRRRVYEVRLLEGTLQYLASLLSRLARQAAGEASDR